LYSYVVVDVCLFKLMPYFATLLTLSDPD